MSLLKMQDQGLSTSQDICRSDWPRPLFVLSSHFSWQQLAKGLLPDSLDLLRKLSGRRHYHESNAISLRLQAYQVYTLYHG